MNGVPLRHGSKLLKRFGTVGTAVTRSAKDVVVIVFVDIGISFRDFDARVGIQRHQGSVVDVDVGVVEPDAIGKVVTVGVATARDLVGESVSGLAPLATVNVVIVIVVVDDIGISDDVAELVDGESIESVGYSDGRRPLELFELSEFLEIKAS